MSSTHAGYLRPSTERAAPDEDGALDSALQAAVVGITGLPGSMVRPRWQEDPPKEPPLVSDNWAAIGVIDIDPNGAPSAIMHHGSGAIGDQDAGPLQGGWDELRREERLRVLVTFYGPSCRTNAAVFRDGLYIDQNRATLTALGFGLIDVSGVVMAPDLVNAKWRKRADVHVRLYHRIDRAYPVRNLQEASGTIASDDTDPVHVVRWDTDNVVGDE